MSNFEQDWWGDCCWTYGEQTKQLVYARLMGLYWHEDVGRWPIYGLDGRSIIDLGGGPCSMLLTSTGGRNLRVVDPTEYPSWVADRYASHDIDLIVEEAETWDGKISDEVWIYNALQHVKDPMRVIDTAWAHASTIRIFEWLEIPSHEGHPWQLHADELDAALGSAGHQESLNENGCVGLSYSGVFTEEDFN